VERVTRGKTKRADYILYYKPNIPIAIIEAKDNNHSVGEGMQQALDYATTLNIPFLFFRPTAATDSSFTTAPDSVPRTKPPSRSTSSLRQNSSGRNTASGKALRRMKKKSSCRITLMTAAARLRATTSPMPSMRR
jgi:type I site-specific restriction endonuclease